MLRAQPHRQLNGVKAALAGAIDRLIEVAQAGQGEQLLRHVVLDPGGGAQRRRGIALAR